MSIRLLHGDCRQVLDSLPEASVQCCVTSPPYWGLRSYLPDDDPLKALEIGSEPTVDEWVATMVDVFRRVRRVLRDDGTLFLNLGDSYAGSWGSQGRDYCGLGEGGLSARAIQAGQRKRSGTGSIPDGASYKPKDLIGQPWLVAFALRADGWWLRQEIIWSKANPMPESARDRCTKSHEHIFLLSKSAQYFWNFDAVQEPVSGTAHARRSIEGSNAKRPGFGHGYDAAPKPRYRAPDGSWSKARTPAGWATGADRAHEELQGNFTAARREAAAVGRRQGPPGNPAESKYGELTGQNSDGLHRTKAGLNRPGVKNNGAMDEALAQQRDFRNPRSVWHFPTEPFKGAHFATFPRELAQRCIRAGTRAGDTVLDPFGGSGTVGLVADSMQRSAVLIDLDRRNLPMAHDRIAGDAPLFAEVATA
jgi:DNA modification methylase